VAQAVLGPPPGLANAKTPHSFFFFEIFITFVFPRISDVNLFASKIGGGGKIQMGVRKILGRS